MSEPKSHSLYELNEYIRRVVSLNFNDSLWISCEISQVNQSRGHYYLELIEKRENSDEIIAQISAVIWVKSHMFISRKLGELTHAILQNGSQVLLKVKLDFNERYGLKLIIEDIDPSYTIGQMEITRQKILERLKNEGLLHLNSQCDIPEVIQRVAVISSDTAAGYQDFIQHLTNNSYGYEYQTVLFKTAMQGKNTESELIKSMELILAQRENFDVVCIIRGGGSKLDLAAFDNYNIAHAIAMADMPVFCGIGHDIDQTIADVVAYYELKTPTAVADYLIEHNLHFESEIQYLAQNISNAAAQYFNQELQHIQRMEDLIKVIPQDLLIRAQEKIKYLHAQLRDNFRTAISKQDYQLANATNIIRLSDPIEVLKKGYAIIKMDDQVQMNPKKLKKGKKVKIQWADGEKSATID